MLLREQILDISRQNQIGELSPFFSQQLGNQISQERFLPEDASSWKGLDLITIKNAIIDRLAAYREKTGAATVVLGMSGGVDSAVTAALFKAAGWRVIGYQLPINQNPEETTRGIEASEALGIEHQTIDLSAAYKMMVGELNWADEALMNDQGADVHDALRVNIRLGNIRARLRMITLYNMASLRNGIVASTDNFSELAAGFWTLHGDVGDVAPIQGLNKSWEVPMLAKMLGVPESTWRATPTDGLGISNGDEAQLGCSYLEWDLMVNWMFDNGPDFHSANEDYNDPRFNTVFEAVYGRMGKSWFKRQNPFNFDHPMHGNVDTLQIFESRFTVPQGI